MQQSRKLQHLCLDKAYNSEPQEQELIKRGYVLHIPYKRKMEVGQGYNTTLLKSEKTFCKKMGCRTNKFMAQ